MKLERLIKVLIWVYLILLIFEGSLRKWIMPSISGPLLIVRDPVVLCIYLAAAAAGTFPSNNALTITWVLAGLSAILAMIFGHGNISVMLFGLHANYLHLPLIWIMGATLKRRDLMWIGVFFMLVAIPNTSLMTKQYNASPTDWINWGAGGEGTGQISGSGDHIRPAGFFSFISGPAFFYPIATAFVIYALLGKRHLLRIIALGGAVATAVAIPVSISRSVFLSILIVCLTGLICAIISGKIAGNIIKIGILVGALIIAIPFVPVFNDALVSFKDRWELSTSDVKTDVGGRWLSGYLEVFDFADSAPFFGYGIGMGTNAGLGLANGQRNYSPAETEWGRVVGELGPLLGFTFIALRCWITGHLVLAALRAWSRQSDSLALLLVSAVGLNMLNGQWGPPTQLGFTIFGAGLVLAAANSSEETAPLETKMAPPAPAVAKKIPAHTGERPPAMAKPLRR